MILQMPYVFVLLYFLHFPKMMFLFVSGNTDNTLGTV
nr:MAG TPA: hypothetical protein [Caudoviricetes sp.]